MYTLYWKERLVRKNIQSDFINNFMLLGHTYSPFKVTKKTAPCTSTHICYLIAYLL